MGQACCSYEPKDANHQNFANKTIDKRNAKLYLIDEEKGKAVLASAKNHVDEVIKV